MERITRRETVRIEKVMFKIPVLSCGHKHRPIMHNQPVRKFYHCDACARNEARQKAVTVKRGPIFSESPSD